MINLNYVKITDAVDSWFSWRFRSHLTDVTSITDGYQYDLGVQLSDYSLWYCTNTTNTSDPSSWHRLSTNDPYSLHLDQTTPQHIVNGTPIFNVGLNINDSFLLNTGYIQFDITPLSTTTVEGKMRWDETEIVPVLGIAGGYDLPLLKSIFKRVQNDSGVILNVGDLVYISGSTGASFVKVKKANATSVLTSYVLGMVFQKSIANQQFGIIVEFGYAKNINTDGLAYGVPLWLSTVDGQFTATRPDAPNTSVFIGYVVRTHTTEGVIALRPTVIPRLTMLSDCYTETPSDNEIYQYNNTNSRFELIDSPEFSNVSLTPQKLGTPTYSTINDFCNSFGSAGRKTGGIISDATGGYISITAGTGFVKATDDDNAQLMFFNFPSPSNIQIPSGTTRYIGVEYNSGTPRVVSRTSFDWNLDTEFPLGRVINEIINEVDNLYIANSPWWVTDGITNMLQWSRGFGLTRRDESSGGLIPSVTGTRNIAVTAGKIWVGLNDLIFSGLDTNISGTFEYYWYKSGSGWQSSDETQYSVTQYNDITQTALQNISANKYCNIWIYGELTDSTPAVAILYPQAQYNTAAEAEAKSAPDNVPEHISEIGMLIGRIIIKQNTDAPVSVQSVFTSKFSSSVVTNHNNLANLQGGTLDEYYHLTNIQHTNLTTVHYKEFIFALEGNTAVEINFASLYMHDGTNFNQYSRLFDDTTREYSGGKLVVPENIDPNGTVTFWAAVTAVTGAADKFVQLSFEYKALTTNEAWDAAMTAEDSGDKAIDPTTGDITIVTWTKTVAELGWEAGDYVPFRISRKDTSAEADLSGDMAWFMFSIKIPQT
jgi:hypothetical protein